MNKTELARKIQTLEGLSNEEKSALLELIRGHKKYGLVWEEKPEDIEEQLRESLPILTEVKEKAIVHKTGGVNDCKSSDYPNHIIIEGDNLASLTALSYTHAGKIDVIYIDPPYNTGNKDFIYNDSYVDKDDAYRHSKWLSFMSKRLRIAKKLLSDRGVIFISIDDNEQANLKLLCDEIFHGFTFISSIIWRKQGGGKSDSKYLANNTEYILCYGNINSERFNTQTPDAKIFNKIDEKGRKYRLMSLDFGSLSYNKSLDYPIALPNGTICYPGGSVDKWEERQKGKYSTKDWTWRCSPKEYQRRLESGIIEFTYNKRTNRWKVQEKLYLDTREGGLFENIISNFTNRTANNEIKSIFGNRSFAYPKPTLLIKFLVSLIRNQNFTILDFFAGSGTTLHAVMQLNAEDGGKRTCILCTNNENGICENVTYERNKRVINGYTKPNGEEVEGLHDNNLRYYRTEFLPRERTAKNMRQLVEASTGLLCIKNDLYTEAPFGGKNMNPKYARYFNDGKKEMLVIYEERAIPVIVNIIKTLPVSETKIKVYVFSHGSYAYNDEFEEVADRVEPCALPLAIYDAYQKVLPKRKPQFLENEIITDTEESIQIENPNQGIINFGDNENKGGAE